MNQNLRTHVLKKGCLLCLSFCLWAGSALLAQNTSISLRVKDKPLKEVLNQIETDEGYIFLYKDKTMDLERKISLDVRNASLETILRRILDEKTEFGISERQVVLYTRKEAAKTSPADTPSRKITVRGTVRDAGGNVLIGVSVVEKGPTNGTATDANGLYSIDVKSAEAILTFSYLSYKTVESAVSTRTQLDVTLEEDAARLDDVVIIGYGAQTKASITGALATVDTKELVKAPVASITNVLAGSVPGVATVQTSGQPGNDAATIYIRGATSAVFGVRGANGVIQITNTENRCRGSGFRCSWCQRRYSHHDQTRTGRSPLNLRQFDYRCTAAAFLCPADWQL